MSDGSRSPSAVLLRRTGNLHSWPIVDERALAKWLIRCLDPARSEAGQVLVRSRRDPADRTLRSPTVFRLFLGRSDGFRAAPGPSVAKPRRAVCGCGSCSITRLSAEKTFKLGIASRH